MKIQNLATYVAEALRLRPKLLYVLAALLLLLLLDGRAWAQTLTATPADGVGSVTPTITWSGFPAGSICTASGGWSGTKATSGTQTLPAITFNATYTLTCVSSTGSATVSWTPPTQNTNGSALTNLAKYRIYRAATSSGLSSATPIEVEAPASTATLNGLPIGTNFFAVAAVNSAGVESALSNVASRTIAGATVSRSASVTVATRPNPPTGLTAVETTAYDVKFNWLKFRYVLNKPVGTVQIGAACKRDFTLRDGYYRVDRRDVDFKRGKDAVVVVAKCG